MSRLVRAVVLSVVAFAASVSTARADTVTASWNANPPSENVTGYILSYGTTSGGPYTTSLNVGNVTTYQVTLSPGQWYYFVLQAYNAGGSSPYSSQASIDLTIAATPPVVVTQPLSQTILASQNAAFSVTASGIPSPTYQWQVSANGGVSWTNLTNAAPYSGTTTATLTVTGVTSSLSGAQYRAVATNSVGTAISIAATLTVHVAPSMTTQPISQTVAAGSSTSFTMAASGTPMPTYQWQVSTTGGSTWTPLTNTSMYGGVTTTTLTLTGVPAALTGAQYRAVATNSVGSTASNAAALMVTTVPVITAQPSNQTVASGSTVSFTAGASGAPAPAYQWQLSANGTAWTNLTNAAPYGGVTTTTLTVTGVPAGLTGSQYRVLATNSVGWAVSNAATLTVTTVPAITVQPSNQTVSDGSTALFTVGASGNPAPGYQWQVSTAGGGPWTNLANTAPYSGVTTATLGVTATAGLSGAQYRAVATNTVGSAISSAATLTVSGSTASPVITTQPFDQAAPVGTSTSFGAAATGNPLPGYQWQASSDNGVTWVNLSNVAPYSGVTSPTLALTNVTAALNGRRHRVVAANSAGSMASNAATLTVVAAPAITTQPANQTVTAGQTVSFTIAANGTPAPAYQWQVSTDSGASWANAWTPSATTPTLTLPGVTTWLNRAQFRCVVTNVAGSAASSAAALRVRGKVSVSPAWLLFSATKAGASGALGTVAPSQGTVSVSFTGAGSAWTATSPQPWLQVTNGSGTDDGSFTVQIVNPGNIIGGSTLLNAWIVVTAAGSSNWPAIVSVTLLVTQALDSQSVASLAAPSGPIGSFDAPLAGTTVQGAVLLSGWALASGPADGIDRVEVWRDVRPGEAAPPDAGSTLSRGKVFVANAPLISGARPDIEVQSDGSPQASRAGWGVSVQTRGLSSQGDGPYTLHAIAYDTAGRSAIIGTTTIAVDNAHATQPFGDLDTPSDGKTVSGTIAVTGWALTPGAECTIAGAGAWMSVDAGPRVTVPYGHIRTDIAAAFPGFTNSNHAGGAVLFDTTTLSGGMHQISWSVTDSCGREASVASRLVVVNNSNGATATGASPIAPFPTSPPSLSLDPVEVWGRTGTIELVHPNAAGTRIIEVDHGDRVDVQLPDLGGAPYAGFHLVNGTWRALPIGSTLASEAGRFTWEPAAGFLGSYALVFIAVAPDGTSQSVWLRIIIGPSVRLQIDQPAAGGEAQQPFELTGWAVDLGAADGTGVDAVEVWATPVDGGAPVRLDVIGMGEARPDVRARYGEPFAASGFRALVAGLGPGTYDMSITVQPIGPGPALSSQPVRTTVR